MLKALSWNQQKQKLVEEGPLGERNHKGETDIHLHCCLRAAPRRGPQLLRVGGQEARDGLAERLSVGGN